MDIDKMAIEVRNLKAFREQFEREYQPLLQWLAEMKTERSARRLVETGEPKCDRLGHEYGVGVGGVPENSSLLKSQTDGPFVVGSDGGQELKEGESTKAPDFPPPNPDPTT
jgi:hypothetical protein